MQAQHIDLSRMTPTAVQRVVFDKTITNPVTIIPIAGVNWNSGILSSRSVDRETQLVLSSVIEKIVEEQRS